VNKRGKRCRGVYSGESVLSSSYTNSRAVSMEGHVQPRDHPLTLYGCVMGQARLTVIADTRRLSSQIATPHSASLCTARHRCEELTVISSERSPVVSQLINRCCLLRKLCNVFVLCKYYVKHCCIIPIVLDLNRQPPSQGLDEEVRGDKSNAG
jgi:hypothetical protein